VGVVRAVGCGLGIGCVTGIVFGLTACSNAVLGVPKGPHPAAGGVRPLPVDSRPPAPQVQVIPDRPNSTCRWLDGEWTWQRNAWAWVEGGWVQSSDACYYAESSLTWQGGAGSAGVLYFVPAQWYRQPSLELCAPPVRCGN
jgi:hypothetical protein